MMNWENILKVQVLGSKQKVKMGIRPLPKEDNNDCWTRLKEAAEYIQQLNSYDTKSLIEEFDEDAACLAIQKLKGYNGGSVKGTFFDDYTIRVDKKFDEFLVKVSIKVEARSRESDKQFCYIHFSRKWQRYPTDYKPNEEQIRWAIMHNETLFNVYNKFLNILGITPEYDTLPFYDKEWFDRRK
jgi:hypothetical protein